MAEKILTAINHAYSGIDNTTEMLILMNHYPLFAVEGWRGRAASRTRVTAGKPTVALARGECHCSTPPRQGETMTTAAMVAVAYDQIDQARAELNAVSK